jgi:hypothetical protein
VSTAYKVVSIRLNYAFGLLERHALAALKQMYLQNFTGMHALAVAQLDEWWGIREAAMKERVHGWLQGATDGNPISHLTAEGGSASQSVLAITAAALGVAAVSIVVSSFIFR